MKKTPKRSYDSECIQECVDQELPRPKDEVIDDFMKSLDNYIWVRVFGRKKEQTVALKHLRQSLEELIS